MFAENPCYITLSTPQQNEVIALLLLLLTLNISHFLLVFLRFTLNVYLKSVFDFFYISIVFRLGWIQVPVIYYRKDFYEVKHFHKVACTAPCLIFSKIIRNFETAVCKQCFYWTLSMIYSGAIAQWKSPWHLSWEEFHGEQLFSRGAKF